MLEIANSKLGLLIISFVLTGLLGAWLNFIIQNKVWKRQKQRELLLNSLQEGRDLFDELAELISKRSYGLFRVLRSLQEHGPSAESEDFWTHYDQSVILWNEKLRSFRIKLEAFAGSKLANEFYSFDDKAALETPTSIHFKVRRCHLEIRRLQKFGGSEDFSQELVKAEAQLDKLMTDVEEFLTEVADELLYKGKKLQDFTL